jgi:outer membrane receptor protein involved in Fe transport
MIMIRKFIILLFTVVLTANLSFAKGENNPPKGKIKGTVADAKSKQPIEYAAVALYKASDNKLITGSITDFLGHFKFDKPSEGEYYLLITFVGLKDNKSDLFTINDGNSNINLGDFFLKSDSENLGEVEVVAKRASIEYRIDKKVINVDKQITAEGGTAVEILENVPSVQVDIEGNVALRGSTGFTVLIDGKPTILEPSDALRQIPSSSIENIEIITNPSAKYEADGATGIINVITKKNYLDGLSGIINLNAGIYGQYGGDLQLNYRVNKVNFVFGTDYNHRARPGDVVNERQTFKDGTIFNVNSSGDTEREFVRSGIRAGLEYNPTKNDFISLSGRYGKWDMSNNSTLLYENWTDPLTSMDTYNSFDETQRGGSYYSLDGVFQHTFAKKIEEPKGKGQGQGKGKGMKSGNASKMKQTNLHNIKLEINYRNRNSDEFSINELRSLGDELLGGKKNVENGPSQSFRTNLDYSLPLKNKAKFEAGLQTRSGRSNDNTELWLYDTITGELNFVPEFSNSTNYARDIFSVYSLYAGYLGDFGYQAGLRGEYTNRKIGTKGEADFTLNRWDFFPTIHTSYNLPADQQIMASYSRRIDRPRGWEMEPFITWQDAYNVRQGNPDLKPEYIDSYDLGYLKKFDDNFFSFEAYYRVTHDKSERVSSVYKIAEDSTKNILLHTVENVGKDYSLGVEAMLNFGIFKWWEMDLSGNLYNYRIEGTLYNDYFERTSTNWSTRFNNTFTLHKNAKLQLSSRYNSSTVTAQGTSSGFFSVDAAFKMSFLQRKLTANIQARNILGTALREHTTEGQDFTSYYKYMPASPVLMLTVSYRFNNFKMNRKSNGNGESDDDF